MNMVHWRNNADMGEVQYLWVGAVP